VGQGGVGLWGLRGANDHEFAFQATEEQLWNGDAGDLLRSLTTALLRRKEEGTDSKNLCIGEYDKFFEEYCLLPI
jgi:hypothetical protein